MRVLQINSTVNSGSTGRIASEIGDLLIKNGYESHIGYGRINNGSASSVIKIGKKLDFFSHLALTRILDRHGFGSKKATITFLSFVKNLNPDIVHLHNIHGYYIHIGELFNFLKITKIPVIWTLHDCWPITGHCSFFDRVDCVRWQKGCFDCPLKNYYPKSWLLDNSVKNYKDKKNLFQGIEKLILVTPSKWLAGLLKNSLLKDYPIKIINNGVNLEIFKPTDLLEIRCRLNLKGKYIILGVANNWDMRKGLGDFLKLRSLLDSDFEIFLVGLRKEQIRDLPGGIKGVTRTESLTELVSLYSSADVFVNPTSVDNFPTVNLEALACGTPVITYNTGGSPESIDTFTGRIVAKGDILNLRKAIIELVGKDRNNQRVFCRERAVRLYNNFDRYNEYISVYKEILKQTI